MGEKEMKQRLALAAFMWPAAFLCLLSCGGKAQKEADLVDFSYRKILRREYVFSVGRAVPLTIEQATELDGAFTRDGSYFFFTSDRERGNFDIYMRPLTGIAVVRVTSHPSRDSFPAVSPDGRYLVFMSQREDPEGDIYVAEIDPQEMLVRHGARGGDPSAVDGRAVNLTKTMDPGTKILRSVKDSMPCWSPDGRLIAYSSSLGGAENIWLMDRTGKKKRQLTRNGGMYPRFSEDGKSIVYVSYRDEGSNGDIYRMELATGEEARITATPFIELSPSFRRTQDEVVYTLIDTDTNGNGRLDLQDDSVIQYVNVKTAAAYPLTLPLQPSFSPQWSPAYDGIILYSTQTGSNININIMPEDGVIPRREKASRQYDLAVSYSKEFDDVNRSLLALERVQQFFGGREDVESVVFSARALVSAGRVHLDRGTPGKARLMAARLSSLSGERTDYRTVQYRYFERLLSGRPGADVLRTALEEIQGDEKKKDFLPYLLEDLGDEQERLGRMKEAAAAYRRLIAGYPFHVRLVNVHHKLARAELDLSRKELPASYGVVLASTSDYLKSEAAMSLIAAFDRIRDPAVRLGMISEMMDRYGEVSPIAALLEYVGGKALFDQRKYGHARDRLNAALKRVSPSDLLFYRSHVLLGAIAGLERDYPRQEVHYGAAANNYRLEWRQPDIRAVAGALIDYYERSGENAGYAGNYGQAAALYRKYVRLLTYLHLRRQFEDLYNEHSPRAHVLYIDAYAQLHGEDVKRLSVLRREYEARLNVARMDFDKAHIYGLGYVLAKMALAVEREEGVREMLSYFKQAVGQCEWALFIDDTFADPYLLSGWIYQYVDVRRREDAVRNAGRNRGIFDAYFSRHLWERNIDLYEKALATNDEAANPAREGNLHLNIANTYFLLTNYPAALRHYEQAARYKRGFGTGKEEALFHYHRGYCYFQTNQNRRALEEMKRTLSLYEALSHGGNPRLYKRQLFGIYRLFALLHRLEKQYGDAVEWFNRALDFASAHSIKIDRARYMQEIGYCYREMGQEEKALAYFDRAGDMLKGRNEAGEKYYLTAEILGVGPIPLWDLGPDRAVVGDNKLYTELDARSVHLLNLSLIEGVYFDRGDFARSVEHLKAKLSLLKKPRSRVDQETRLRTIGNLGYGYFRIGDYRQAHRYFRDAWRYAGDTGLHYEEGVFSAIRNTANLYAFLSENGIRLFESHSREIDGLIRDIEGYRDRFEEARMLRETEALEEKAKARNRAVSAEELAAASKTVRVETDDLYYNIDIALGVLAFYKAEESVSRGASDESRPIEAALRLYREHRDLYELYASAKWKFEAALPRAEGQRSKRLLVKLLANIGACQERMGQFGRAYGSYSDARGLSEDYRYDDLTWLLHCRLGRLLASRGEELAGRDSSARTGEHYEAAIGRVEDLPLAYADRVNAVKRIYDEYSTVLAERGDWRRVLALREKRCHVLRILLVQRIFPAFSTAEENSRFAEVRDRTARIGRAEIEISSLLEKGKSPASLEVSALLREHQALKNGLRDSRRSIEQSLPLLGSHLFVPEQAVRSPAKALIFQFYLFGDKAYAWKRSPSGLAALEFDLGGREGPDSRHERVRRFMQGEGMEADLPRFVVLDEHAIEILGRNNMVLDLPPFTFAPSSDRAVYYLDDRVGPVKSIHVADNDLKKRLMAGFGAGVSFLKGGAGSADLELSALIVDRAAGSAFGPETLFSTQSGAQVLIKEVSALDPDLVFLFMESSLNSGIRSLVLHAPLAVEEHVALIKECADSPIDRLNTAGNAHGIRILAIGNRGADYDTRLKQLPRLLEEHYKRYEERFGRGDAAGARISLMKWRQFAGTDSENLALFRMRLAEIALLKDDRREAASILADVLERPTGIQPELLRRAAAFTIYLDFLDGNLEAAQAELGRWVRDPLFAATGDRRVFEAIADLLKKGKRFRSDEHPLAGTHRYLVPENKLRVLYAHFLSLHARGGEAPAMVERMPLDYPLSDRELCRLAMNRVLPEELLKGRPRARGVVELINDSVRLSASSSGAARLIYHDGRLDGLSVFPAIIALRPLAGRAGPGASPGMFREDEIRGIAQASHWMDSLSFLSLFHDVSSAEGRYDDALTADRHALSILKNRRAAALEREFRYRAAVALARLGRHAESLEIAKAEEPAAAKEGDNESLRFTLLIMENEIALGNAEAALQQAKGIPRDDMGEYGTLFNLLQVRARLAQMVGKGKAAEGDLQEAERLLKGALHSMDTLPPAGSSLGRSDLVEQGMDFLISYRMSRGDTLSALIYAEVKKQLAIQASFPFLLRDMNIPGPALSEFSGMEDRVKDRKRFISLLQEYPQLQVAALAGTIPIEEFQKKIADDAVVIYLVKNEDDIMGWIIARQFMEPLRLKGGYTRIEALRERYGVSVAGLASIAGISRELYSAFKPLERFYRNRKRVIFITDRALEWVPFEIMGEKAMLEDSHDVFYLSSIISALREYAKEKPLVSVLGEPGGITYLEVEKRALGQSGIRFTVEERGTSGYSHLFSPLSYNPVEGMVYAGDRRLPDAVPGGTLLYLPSAEFTGRIGFNDLALLASLQGMRGVIVNNAAVHDINNAVFIDSFYRSVSGGKDILTSFAHAKQSVRERAEHRHPAYWSGVRLYLNGL